MNEYGKTKRIVFHAVSIAAIVISLLFSVFRFSASALRTWQGARDFGLSFAFNLLGFVNMERRITPTVQYIPGTMVTMLPVSFDEFKTLMRIFWELFTDWGNVQAYFVKVGSVCGRVGKVSIILMMPLGMLLVLAWLLYYTVDTKTGKKSGALKGWLRMESIFYYPVKRTVQQYVNFIYPKKPRKYEKKFQMHDLDEHRQMGAYLKLFLLIWAWNFNLFTICLEGFAFLFYLPFSRDFGNVFVQVAKLAVDLTVIIQFLPAWVLVVLGLIVFDKYRRNKGYERLDADEDDNRRFLEEYPGNLLATGPPRAGKTQAITDMSVSQEIVWREKTRKKSLRRSMEFPFFEWGILEQSILVMRERIPDFCLESVRQWIRFMKCHFYARNVMNQYSLQISLNQLKRLGYQGDDFIFNYDYKRYGLEYDNALKIVNLFETVELYAEEFFIYTSPTPMIFGNYPIRTQIQWQSFGNYPKMKPELFRVSPRKAFHWSQYSHIVNQDGLRLGVKKNPKGKYNDAYDRGALVLSELGKELGNQNTNRGQDKNALQSNPNNDLWTTNAKMISHGTTVGFETYFRIFGDEQRAMSILADFRELGSEMKIQRKNRKDKIKMPFFAWGELIYTISEGIMDKIFMFFKSRHGLTTLLYYLILRVYSVIFNHYHRICNTYASYDVELDMKDWANGEDGKATGRKGRKKNLIEVYHISRKKVCSDVYNTIFWSTVYREKWKRSKVGGLDQTPQFTGLDVTKAQMLYQESHFNEKVFEYFGIETERKASTKTA